MKAISKILLVLAVFAGYTAITEDKVNLPGLVTPSAKANIPEVSKFQLCRYAISLSGSASPEMITVEADSSNEPYGYYNREFDGQLFGYACFVRERDSYVMLSTLPDWELLENTEYHYTYDGHELKMTMWQHQELIDEETFIVEPSNSQ